MSDTVPHENLPTGTVARLKVQTSPSSTSWPYAEKLPHGRGWQSGAVHYPESQVVSVEAVFEDARSSTVTTEAELNALPDQTVIRSRFGVVYERWCDGLSDCWHKPASMSDLPPHVPTLPATVLFRPV